MSPRAVWYVPDEHLYRSAWPLFSKKCMYVVPGGQSKQDAELEERPLAVLYVPRAQVWHTEHCILEKDPKAHN